MPGSCHIDAAATMRVIVALCYDAAPLRGYYTRTLLICLQHTRDICCHTPYARQDAMAGRLLLPLHAADVDYKRQLLLRRCLLLRA